MGVSYRYDDQFDEFDPMPDAEEARKSRSSVERLKALLRGNHESLVAKPDQGSLPRSWAFDMNDILYRARQLLSGRTADEIRDAAATIDWMLDVFFEDEKRQAIREAHAEDWCHEDIEEHLTYRIAGECSPVDVLSTCIRAYDLSDPALEFANGKEHEYFAVMAMVLAVESSRWLQRKDIEGRDATSIAIAGEYGVEAMHAVGHAEYRRVNQIAIDRGAELDLLHVEVKKLLEWNQRSMDVNDELSQELALLRHARDKAIKEGIKELRSADGRKAAIASKRKYRDLEDRVRKHYEANRARLDQPKPDGGQGYCYSAPNVAEKVTKEMSLTNVELSTIANWVRAFRKQSGPVSAR